MDEKMKAIILKPKQETWKKAILSLVKKGQLTVEQANECLKRLEEKKQR